MKPHPLIIHNRAGLPADKWYQIEVTGEHHNAKADVLQVIDIKAVDSMVKNFDRNSEMLIDIDHFSHDQSKETRAYGWLTDIRNRDGELEGKIEWTETGEPAVLGKDYKFFSTEYDPKLCERINNKSYRPLTLSGLSLTNRPNNVGGKPIMNRDIEETAKDDLSKRLRKALDSKNENAEPNERITVADLASAAGIAEATMTSILSGEIKNPPEHRLTALAKALGVNSNTLIKNRTNPNTPNEMNAIATALGLAEDATEEQILEAISKLTTKGESQEEEIEKFQNREADRLVESYVNKIGDNADVKAHWKTQLITNREASVKVLDLMPELKPEKSPNKPLPKRMHNRSTAVAPESIGSKDSKEQLAEEKQAKLITNRCAQLRAENPNRSFNECWSQAESENA